MTVARGLNEVAKLLKASRKQTLQLGRIIMRSTWRLLKTSALTFELEKTTRTSIGTDATRAVSPATLDAVQSAFACVIKAIMSSTHKKALSSVTAGSVESVTSTGRKFRSKEVLLVLPAERDGQEDPIAQADQGHTGGTSRAELAVSLLETALEMSHRTREVLMR